MPQVWKKCILGIFDTYGTVEKRVLSRFQKFGTTWYWSIGSHDITSEQQKAEFYFSWKK